MRLKAARHTTINFRHRAGKGWFWGKGNSLLVGGVSSGDTLSCPGKGLKTLPQFWSGELLHTP